MYFTPFCPGRAGRTCPIANPMVTEINTPYWLRTCAGADDHGLRWIKDFCKQVSVPPTSFGNTRRNPSIKITINQQSAIKNRKS
jgi:hypothetical protein